MDSCWAYRLACCFSARRNCSLAPDAAVALMAVVATISLGVGLAFAAVGAWPVLPFSGLEIIGLVWALLAMRRHAGDCERITLDACRLRVEIREAGRWTRHELNASWAQVVAGGDGSVRLRGQGREIVVGRHLDAQGRCSLATELRRRLAALRQGTA